MNTITLRTQESLCLDLDDAHRKIEKLEKLLIAITATAKNRKEHMHELQRKLFDLETDNYELRNRRD